MRRFLFLMLFVSIAQLFYGQEKYTITGELPDHSLDNTYLRLMDISALGEERERVSHAFSDSILVKDGKFFYEGVLSRKPFLAWISSLKKEKMLNVNFVIEAGNIHIRVANWYDKAVLSGTPINEDYNTCMIAERNQENQLYFFEKYASCPDVIRMPLSFHIKGKKASKNPYFSKYMQVLDKMPEPDRSILLSWRDYTIQKEEYRKKTKPLLDSIRKNAPRFVETVPAK